MGSLACNSIRDSLLAYLAAQTVVHEDDGECIVTVPVNTLDNRWVDIVVESHGPNFFVVHDSAKSVDELFLQGVGSSDKKTDVLRSIASRYGVQFADGKFITGTDAARLQQSIWAVAQCSNLAMSELLRHKPTVEDEAVKVAVGNIITAWGVEKNVRVQRSVSVQGETAHHTFDFIADSGRDTVAINVLNPGANSLARAQRYGFQGFDTRETYRSYKRMAVLANPDVWSTEARKIVERHANKTVEFSSPATSSIVVVDSLGELIKAA